MRLSGHPHNYDKDEDIAELLHGGSEEEVSRAIALIHDRWGESVCGMLRKKCSWLSPDDLIEIYYDGLLELALYARDGRFEERESKSGALGLLKEIVKLDAIDLLRRDKRQDKRNKLYRTYLFQQRIPRFDGPHQLSDLVPLINKYIDTKLKNLEKLAIRTFVELLRDGDGAETDRSPMCLLPDKVNSVLGPPGLPDEKIRLALRSAIRKLRRHLKAKGVF